MTRDVLARRRRLEKVVDAMRRALRKKFGRKSPEFASWNKDLKRVENRLDLRSIPAAAEELQACKLKLSECMVFTESRLKKFGNGHPKNCICIHCMLEDPKLEKYLSESRKAIQPALEAIKRSQRPQNVLA